MDDERDVSERAGWSEMVKELTLSGLATLFMTEESVKSYLKEKKLPKELVSIVLESLTKKKEDFYRLLVSEFGRVVSRVDLTKELSRFLETHHVEFQGRVSFVPKEGHENRRGH